MISGTATLVFTPTTGFGGISSVSFYQQPPVCCGGGTFATVDTPAPDGTFRISVDTKNLVQDANAIGASVSFTDPFGQGHGYSAPTVAVTVSNPPVINNLSPDRYFSPNGDNQDDTTGANYMLSKGANVTVTGTASGATTSAA